jgi:protein ImuA
VNLSLPLFDLPPPPSPADAAPVRTPAARRGAAAGLVPPGVQRGLGFDEAVAPAAFSAPAAGAPAGLVADEAGEAAEADEADLTPALPLADAPWGGLPRLPPARPLGRTPASAAPPHHPAVWRADQLGGGRLRTTPSGFAPLDAQLPGGGWPHGMLTELLLAQPGIGELRLLAPALAAVSGPADPAADPSAPEGGRCVMLFDPPAALSAWGLAQQGLASRHWLVVQARGGAGAGRPADAAAAAASAPPRPPRGSPRTPDSRWPLLPSADLMWALEQSLRSGHVGAVLAWLPLTLRADALRRLQLAAQAHDGPVFLFRDAQVRSKPSAAPLRLLLQPAGVDDLAVRVLKRRGPPLAEPLRLALPPVLPPQQQAQARTRLALQGATRAPLRMPVAG